MDEPSKFPGGVGSVLSDPEHLLVGVVGERLEVDGVGFLVVEWVWDP